MKVLVTGGTGLIGNAFLRSCPTGVEILSVQRTAPAVKDVVKGVDYIKLDVRDEKEIAALLRNFRADVVLHTAGEGSVDVIEHNPALGQDVIFNPSVALCRICRELDSQLVYLSSNAVFDGTAAPYAENAKPNPINAYGKVKHETEITIQLLNPEALIVRPILTFGWPLPGQRGNPLTLVTDTLKRGGRLHIVDDIFENPISATSLAEALWRLVREKSQGVFHIGGAESVSRFEFSVQVARVLGLDASLISPVQADFFLGMAPRPRNTTLLTDKIQHSTGWKPQSLADSLACVTDGF